MAPPIGSAPLNEKAPPKKKESHAKTMRANNYNFKGSISDVFEPYLLSYSESEERKVVSMI